MTVVQVSPGWVPVAGLLLLGVAAAAAGLDGALAARTQGRPAGGGLLLPLAETARLFRQRRRATLAADAPLRWLGITGLLTAALLMAAVIPFGRWTVADLAVGIVWFNAVDVLLWAAVWLAGWGPNSVHPLVGGYRFLAQALCYELPLMFALTAPAVAAGSLRLGDVVAAQQGLWFVVWMPVAFAVCCTAVVAFSVWGPFGAPLGTGSAGGVLAEAAGVDRWLVSTGRYALLTAGAAFTATAFLGGGQGPLLPAWLWVLVKTAVLLAVFVVLARRLPVVRPERLAVPAWLVVLPLTLLQLLVVSVVVVVRA